MKKIILALGLALSMLSFNANAAWYCESYSADATGWAQYHSRARAQSRALYQCRIRTSSRNYCTYPSCVRTRGEAKDEESNADLTAAQKKETASEKIEADAKTRGMKK